MSTLRLTTISNQSGSASVPSDTVINGSAKAWVNFNGTGTIAIRQAFNVSSITDNGLGDYTVNLATAMPDANYIVSATGGQCLAGVDVSGFFFGVMQNGNMNGLATSKTASAVRMAAKFVNQGGQGDADYGEAYVAIFR